MYELTKKDFELIEHAKKVIQANYDETNDRHTVGAAVRIPPNGSGRQLLHDYAPNCKVILLVNDELHKIAAKKLLPFS